MTEATSTLPVPAELQHAPSDEEIQQIRKRGTAVVAYRKEVNEIFRTLEGMEWGSGTSAVRGTQFSEQTRYALAVFCRITGANPLTQVDILGGKPYLNAAFWSDKINRSPHFHHFDQRDLSPSVQAAHEDKAKQLREMAKEIKPTDEAKAAEYTTRAFEAEEMAEEIRDARVSWSPPAWAEVVIETSIYRFIDAAPLEKIRAGEITDLNSWLICVRECNWAGGRPKEKKKNRQTGKEYEYQPDPVGNAEPAKTARTRSLRRASTRAFAAWGQDYEQQVRKAEEAIEAEFEIITNGNTDGAPAAGEPQAVHTGNGEPEAAREEGAVDLPETGRISEEQEEPEAAPSEPEASEPSWNEEDDRKRLFATLREAGIEDRKAWQAEHGLPESTKDWGPDEYQRAFQELTAGPISMFKDGCEVLGLDPAAVAQEVLGHEPDTLKDYNLLNNHLATLADGEAQQDLLS